MSSVCENLEIGSAKWHDSLYSIKHTKSWQSYLLSLLEKDEKIEEYPTAEGLARLFRLVFGEFSTTIDVIKPPSIDDISATVVVSILCNSNYHGQIKHAGSADVSPNNTKHPFCLHPVATAETKALGRALKRGLHLKIHTHEEMLNDDTQVNYDKIDEKQIRAIKNMCNKLDVNSELFLAENCGITQELFESPDSTLSKSDGTKMLEELNNFRNKGVPEKFAETTVGQGT